MPPTAANNNHNPKLVKTVVGILKSKAEVNNLSSESLNLQGLGSNLSGAKQDEVNSHQAANLDFKIIQNN